ncbi:MAG TPA: hypothetical protein VJQ56_04355, partial [Blastocatellia bacterium]|nr:hypothetical protein [Blastocatellia bacterium]
MKLVSRFIVTALFCLIPIHTAPAATLSPALNSQIAGLPDATRVGTVIIAFNTATGLHESHLNLLRGIGIVGGRTLPNLGMVAVNATVAQVRSLAARGEVRSIWGNERLEYHLNHARLVAGVDRLRVDTG